MWKFGDDFMDGYREYYFDCSYVMVFDVFKRFVNILI